ncbi:MAG: phage portal protein [Planctomycetes bacterium]|nr:phage portal protein [Planctomycetota bacterium]
MRIRDRVKTLERIRAGDLIPNPKNWRLHPQYQQDALREVLAEIGYADALLAREVSPGKFMLIDGHLRAETTPDEIVPVLVLDITDAEADKGPRPSLSIPGVDSQVIRQIENAFEAWKLATGLTEKLRLKTEAKICDGESYSIMVTNPAIDHDIKLDIRTYEADQVTTPYLTPFDHLAVDGIRLDSNGNPIEYHFLKYAPGQSWWMSPTDYDKIPAKDVLVWSRPDRPGQLRCVPEITPALPLFGQLRRYTVATLTAAEVAAMLAGVMKSNGTATASPADQPGLGRLPV